MRKNFFILLLFILLLGLTACGKGQVGNEDKVNGMPKRGMPDFGQPEENPDVVGVVKSVLGNEVTILKIERPEGNLDQSDKKEGGSQDSNKSLSFGGGTGRMPGMGKPGGASDNNDDMIEKIKKMSTGEESIIIPVGIQMLKTEVGERGTPTALEANLNDVETDKMISIWLNKDISDRKVASFVLIK